MSTALDKLQLSETNNVRMLKFYDADGNLCVKLSSWVLRKIATNELAGIMASLQPGQTLVDKYRQDIGAVSYKRFNTNNELIEEGLIN